VLTNGGLKGEDGPCVGEEDKWRFLKARNKKKLGGVESREKRKTIRESIRPIRKKKKRRAGYSVQERNYHPEREPEFK